VSPLWRDEVAIYIAPRKLALVRHGRGPRPRLLASTELAVLAGASGDFAPVFARLADVLSEETWHRAIARVVVADHWARYGVVPWPTARLDAAGRLTHARYVLGDAYGEAVANWAVTLADTPPGRSYVACAIPSTLRGALDDALAPARLELASLQPQLVVAFNVWRDRLPAEDTWFVRLDDGSLSAVHLTNGAWDRVHMARVSSEFAVELERLQAFSTVTRTAEAPRRMFVDAPAWMRRSVAANAAIEWLEEDAGDGAQTHELALLQRMYA
jgi:hypothetical protein